MSRPWIKSVIGLLLGALGGSVAGAYWGGYLGELLGHPEREGFIGFIYGLRVGGIVGAVTGFMIARRVRPGGDRP